MQLNHEAIALVVGLFIGFAVGYGYKFVQIEIEKENLKKKK